MRRLVTAITLLLFLGSSALAQKTELSTDYFLEVANSADATIPYPTGAQSGAREVVGPYDLDGDGKMEVLISDYSGGGRVHVIENVSADLWEMVYSIPYDDVSNSAANARCIIAGDLDGDGRGEIILQRGWGYASGSAFVPGIYVYEHTGTDNDYGTTPASVFDYAGDLPDRFVCEQMSIADVDGDGQQELLVPNNGSNNLHDRWDILSVTGDIGGGFETWVTEAKLTSRALGLDPINRGGGSPYSILGADLNGDGSANEIIMNSWNNFNLTVGQGTAANTYSFADGDVPGVDWIHATAADRVALFGGVVVDIEGNGDDEVLYPVYSSEGLIVVNYEAGENPLAITADQVVQIKDGEFSSLGIAAGDLDGDGFIEVYGSGPGNSASLWTQGQGARFVEVTEYLGGHPENPASWSDIEYLDVSVPADSANGAMYNSFTSDSLGTVTTTYSNGATPLAYNLQWLGDADGDGFGELAMTHQGVVDSTTATTRTWNVTTAKWDTTMVKASAPRIFMRVIQGTADLSVRVVDERIVVPDNYILHDNYPNPFNPSTTLSFELPLDKTVSLTVYDMSGRLIDALIDNETLSKGTHYATWNADGVPSGTYLYTLSYGNYSKTKTMTLLK